MRSIGRCAGLALAALSLAGCETTSRMTETTSGPIAISVAGMVGVSAPVAEKIAGELGRIGPERRFSLVAANDPSARYSMRGHFAKPDDGAGSLFYVWDLFEANGARAQRIAGSLRVAGGFDAPTAARDIALASASAIERYLAAPRERLAEAPPAPATAQAAPVPAPATPSSPGRRIAIERVVGLEPAHETRLRAAAQKSLAEVGYTIVPPGQIAEARLSAEATVNPPEAGRRMVAFVWRVLDAERRALGEIRQMTKVTENALAAQGGETLERAVEQALPGLLALVPPRQ